MKGCVSSVFPHQLTTAPLPTNKTSSRMDLKKCCEKCHGYYVEPRHEYFPLCNDHSCLCHAAPKDHIRHEAKMVAPKENQCNCSSKGYCLREPLNIKGGFQAAQTTPQTGIGELGRTSDFTHSSKCSGVHQGAYCYPLDDIRGAIVGMTSAMLDNPSKDGIYPTTRFYERLEEYTRSLIHQAREEGRREYQDVVEAEVGKAHEIGVEEGRAEALKEAQAAMHEHYWDTLMPDKVFILAHTAAALASLTTKKK